MAFFRENRKKNMKSSVVIMVIIRYEAAAQKRVKDNPRIEKE